MIRMNRFLNVGIVSTKSDVVIEEIDHNVRNYTVVNISTNDLICKLCFCVSYFRVIYVQRV
jgi:hypothetical protein